MWIQTTNAFIALKAFDLRVWLKVQDAEGDKR